MSASYTAVASYTGIFRNMTEAIVKGHDNGDTPEAIRDRLLQEFAVDAKGEPNSITTQGVLYIARRVLGEACLWPKRTAKAEESPAAATLAPPDEESARAAAIIARAISFSLGEPARAKHLESAKAGDWSGLYNWECDGIAWLKRHWQAHPHTLINLWTAQLVLAFPDEGVGETS